MGPVSPDRLRGEPLNPAIYTTNPSMASKASGASPLVASATMDREQLRPRCDIGIQVRQRALGIGRITVALGPAPAVLQRRNDTEVDVHGLVVGCCGVGCIRDERAERPRPRQLKRPGARKVGVGVERGNETGGDGFGIPLGSRDLAARRTFVPGTRNVPSRTRGASTKVLRCITP